jgi:hypothetical protein
MAAKMSSDGRQQQRLPDEHLASALAMKLMAPSGISTLEQCCETVRLFRRGTVKQQTEPRNKEKKHAIDLIFALSY